jgi:hypothetical protein
MTRLDPEELWQKHLLELYAAFTFSKEFSTLRTEGLAILGRKTLFTVPEWWSFSEERLSKEYQGWYEKCKLEGEHFGLSPWVVEMACLLEGYHPDKEAHPIGTKWPQVRVVTENTDLQFLNWLAYHAQKLGLYVVQRQGSVETPYVLLFPIPIVLVPEPPPPTSFPDLSAAFQMRVEVPNKYPPKAAARLQTEAGKVAKQLITALGYKSFQRLRASSLTKSAKSLKVDAKRLPHRGLNELVVKQWPEDELAPTEIDTKRAKLIKSRKRQLRERLIKPYEKPV